MQNMEEKIKQFMAEVSGRKTHDYYFLQAVQEVTETVIPDITTQKNIR